MKKEVEKSVTRQLLTTAEAFICPKCETEHTMIEAQANMDPETYKFKCRNCDVFLEESAKVVSSKQQRGFQRNLAQKQSIQFSTDKMLDRDGIIDILMRLKEIGFNDLPENLPENHLKEAEVRFRDMIARKKMNNEIDEEELDRFLYQLETLKNENVSFLETDIRTKRPDQSLNSLHNDISKLNESTNQQSVLFKDQGPRALPLFFQKDLEGQVTQSAIDDQREREQHKVVQHLNSEKKEATDNFFTDDEEEYGGATDMLNFRKSLTKVS